MPSRHFLNRSEFGAIAVVALLAAVAACSNDAQGPAPPTAEIDADTKSRITVSGVSAVGFMAVQSHVAFAARIGGEGLAVEPLIRFTRDAAATGDIAPLAGLESARVWIFHSPADAVVAPAAGRALRDFYQAFVPEQQIEFVDDVETAHGWPTLDAGAACMEWGGDYINDCDYDAAGSLLRHLYGDLRARAPQAKAGNLVDLDVSAYFGSGSDVGDMAYAYVPDACRSKVQDCGLHIAFHGCAQGAEFIDDRFATQAGFNEWAESNNIIVVYPQVEKSLFNPKGCWDWWGYTDEDYDVRSGKQLAGVAALIDSFVSGTLLP